MAAVRRPGGGSGGGLARRQWVAVPPATGLIEQPRSATTATAAVAALDDVAPAAAVRPDQLAKLRVCTGLYVAKVAAATPLDCWQSLTDGEVALCPAWLALPGGLFPGGSRKSRQESGLTTNAPTNISSRDEGSMTAVLQAVKSQQRFGGISHGSLPKQLELEERLQLAISNRDYDLAHKLSDELGEESCDARVQKAVQQLSGHLVEDDQEIEVGRKRQKLQWRQGIKQRWERKANM
eukprot:SM000034S12706  [mRNA]  locus=s34:296359:297985:+ [translate_table: standard]